MERVHAEIAHASVLAVELGAALPVDRLGRVQVAGVQKLGTHLEHAAEAALADEAQGLLAPGEERKLGGAAYEELRMRRDRGIDRVVRGEVDPEGLLAEQVLTSVDNGGVELLVQVVRHRAVDRLDKRVREQLSVVRHESRTRFESFVPREHLGIEIANDGDLRAYADARWVHLAGSGARKLATHQPAAGFWRGVLPTLRRGRRAAADL